QKLGRSPTAEEIAASADISLERADSAIELSQSDLSLDAHSLVRMGMIRCRPCWRWMIPGVTSVLTRPPCSVHCTNASVISTSASS
ncbi:MAG TPA: hypothetical protein DIC52_08980, partial [Candidatus Latescibacteria bacterium]|nr:hypothetical protein [Candidatus Latescibacterota bacterium]